jgi:RNA polymerase sigma-70 factor (ECF subfamily)
LSQDDLALIRKVAGGETEALRALYDAYSRGVYALLSRMLGSAAEAEEQLQEVFVTLWREAARFDPARGSLKVWIYTIARHRALDLIRARQSRPQLGSEEDAAQTYRAQTVADTPEDGAQAGERARAVASAMARLSPKQREVLDLAYFQGLSQYEIAAKLNVPVGTIKSRVRDAMIQLRGALSPHQDE